MWQRFGCSRPRRDNSKKLGVYEYRRRDFGETGSVARYSSVAAWKNLIEDVPNTQVKQCESRKSDSDSGATGSVDFTPPVESRDSPRW